MSDTKCQTTPVPLNKSINDPVGSLRPEANKKVTVNC